MVMSYEAKIECRGCGALFEPKSDRQYFERVCADCSDEFTEPELAARDSFARMVRDDLPVGLRGRNGSVSFDAPIQRSDYFEGWA